MKKNLKISFLILIVIAILLPITYSFAIENIIKTEKEKSFFEVSQLEVSPNEKIEMTIYFEKIKYEKFEFTLQSSSNIENVVVTNTGNSQVEKNSNELAITIDKAQTNVNQINLYYQVPETAQVNDVIKFIATVTNTTTEKSTDTIQSDVTSEEAILEENTVVEDSTVTTIPSEPESQTIEVQVKIVEKNNEMEDTREENDNKKNDDEKENKMPNDMDDERMQDKKERNEKDNESGEDKEFSKQVSSTSSQKESSTVTVTYNGSDNNYLSKLSVDGYALNKEFSKDNSTYFITVSNDIIALNINAIAEESSATVCIYGNENLEEGTNKVLISVTAENGNVRNYRIYVTKNA